MTRRARRSPLRGSFLLFSFSRAEEIGARPAKPLLRPRGRERPAAVGGALPGRRVSR